MATFGEVQNGLRKRSNSRRKNSATAKPKKRNGTTKAGAASFAKKNGMVLISRTALNGRKKKHHRRHKRNGIAAVSRSRNGIFGNTKHDATQVVALLGGMGATKIIGRIVGNFVSPYISQLGVGNYSGIVSEALVAVFVVPMVAKKISPSSAQNARLGGLAVVGLSLIEKFGGTSLAGLNPFNTSPIVMSGNQPLIAPNAVAQIVGNTSATAAEKAQVAGAMRALQSGQPVTRNGSPKMRMGPLYR